MMPAQMKELKLTELRPGITLPTDIKDGKNADLLLLAEGKKVTTKQIQQLLDRGVQTIAVDARFIDQIKKPKSANEVRLKQRIEEHQRNEQAEKERRKQERSPLLERRKTTREAVYDPQHAEQNRERLKKSREQLKQIYSELDMPGHKDGQAIKGIAVDSVEHMLEDMDLFVKLAIEQNKDSKDYDHCVRVSQLAMAIATVMEYNQKDVTDVGIGCLIFRSGYRQKAKTIAAQNREITNMERLELSKNPVHMYEALESVSDLSAGARQVAYQIYERWDGSGYPRKRVGNQIHPLARIASVADVYIALTSDRPHRKAYLSYDAIAIILKLTQEGKFDPKVVKGLFKTTSLYPLGTNVMLNDGSLAVVLRTNPEAYGSPVVKILSNEHGEADTPFIVDLSDNSHLKIVKVIDSTALEELLVVQKKTHQTRQLEFSW